MMAPTWSPGHLLKAPRSRLGAIYSQSTILTTAMAE